MSDQQRLNHLKSSPQSVTQHGGCCGFAAALMGLLVHRPSEIDALYDTLTKGQSYRGIEKSTRVGARVQKRIEAGFLKPTATNYLDARLSFALMILLKEYLKDTGKEDIWQGCSDYSQLFHGWQYGKLKGLNDIKDAGQLYPFSYKHGDLALTVYALLWLLVMVGFESVDAHRLISNEDVADKKKMNMLPSLENHGGLRQSLGEIVSWIDRGIYAGGVVGVAKHDFIGVKEHEPYEYISHWVYLPKQNPSVNDVWKAVTWTWGQPWTFKALLGHARKYVPKVAIVFKKAGRGVAFV